jgi:hypothetical protein
MAGKLFPTEGLKEEKSYLFPTKVGNLFQYYSNEKEDNRRLSSFFVPIIVS